MSGGRRGKGPCELWPRAPPPADIGGRAIPGVAPRPISAAPLHHEHHETHLALNIRFYSNSGAYRNNRFSRNCDNGNGAHVGLADRSRFAVRRLIAATGPVVVIAMFEDNGAEGRLRLFVERKASSMTVSRQFYFRWFLTKPATMHMNPVRKAARRQGPAGPNGLLICARIDEGRLWDLLAPGSFSINTRIVALDSYATPPMESL